MRNLSFSFYSLFYIHLPACFGQQKIGLFSFSFLYLFYLAPAHTALVAVTKNLSLVKFRFAPFYSVQIFSFVRCAHYCYYAVHAIALLLLLFLFLYYPQFFAAQNTLAGSAIVLFSRFLLLFQPCGGKVIFVSIIMPTCRHFEVFWAAPKKLINLC